MQIVLGITVLQNYLAVIAMSCLYCFDHTAATGEFSVAANIGLTIAKLIVLMIVLAPIKMFLLERWLAGSTMHAIFPSYFARVLFCSCYALHFVLFMGLN